MPLKRISKIITQEIPKDFREKALQWAGQFTEVVFLDSNSQSQTSKQAYQDFDAVLAVGARTYLKSDFKNAFDQLKDFQGVHQDYMFGFLGYDLKNDIEQLYSNHTDHIGFPDLYFFQPEKIFLWKNEQVELLYPEDTAHEMEEDLKHIRELDLFKGIPSNNPYISKRMSRASYSEKVSNIMEHIHRGDIYEVNFCQEFYAKNALIDPVAVYHKLSTISQAPFASYLKLDDKFMLCASPERFVKRQGQKIVAQPIKGTARRVNNSRDDLALAEELSNDPKERAENIMIVDLIRNDLSKHAKKGTVSVEELCKVYSFKQVHQLISTVVCEVSKSTHAVDIIKDLFPMGSMTGAPKISAMQIIEEEEETKRGLYSGAVGYFTPEGDFDFNVVIRSILYNSSGNYASFSVGSAITSLSVVENEYQECLLKASALKEALTN